MTVRVEPALIYRSVYGFRPLLLDLYRSPDAGRAPVILYVHGGGFAVGDRTFPELTYPAGEPTFHERLVAAGFAVATVDYRLSGEARFPAPVNDLKAAVRWLRAHAAQYGLDPDRIVAWGLSAGGHLAALLGLTGDRAALPGEPPRSAHLGAPATAPTPEDGDSSVAAVIDWFGPTDLTTLHGQGLAVGGMAHDAADSPEGQLIGGRVSAHPDLARAASPVAYVHPAAPPFLIQHGADDTVVPCAQSRALATALRAAGCAVDTEWVPGAQHGFDGAADPAGRLDRALAWARRVAGLER